ncbi:MAG: type II toxin-antitoxin system Phd/YefM family antitoxin [Propionibacteriaceae bacterium]|nr:type II toxin-antitoxin system Phd/YefM family antitoxin [Propionibacteriaceae bacterium]
MTSEVSTRELRAQFSDVLGRAMYAGERIGVTRNGKLAAVVVGVADLDALEEFEMAQDVAAYCEAKASASPLMSCAPTWPRDLPRRSDCGGCPADQEAAQARA